MQSELMKLYEETFNEVIELPIFLELDSKEQNKILRECLEKKQRLYENDYFNETYMEEVKD